jgi:hypothetical protein
MMAVPTEPGHPLREPESEARTQTGRLLNIAEVTMEFDCQNTDSLGVWTREGQRDGFVVHLEYQCPIKMRPSA